MRKYILGLIATLTIVGMSFGQSANYELFDKIGVLHNNALDYFLRNSSLNIPNTLNIEKINTEIRNYSNSTKELSNFSNDVVNGFELISKTTLDGGFKNMKNSLPKLIDKILINSSQEQKNQLNIILFPEKFDNFSDYRKTLSTILIEVTNNTKLTSNEKDVLFFAIAIGNNSSKYWEENGDLWINTKTRKLPNDFWRNFVKADISNGIAGGIGGAVGGAVTVPVIGAVPGWVVGAVGGAIGGSVGWGVAEILFP